MEYEDIEYDPEDDTFYVYDAKGKVIERFSAIGIIESVEHNENYETYYCDDVDIYLENADGEIVDTIDAEDYIAEYEVK